MVERGRGGHGRVAHGTLGIELSVDLPGVPSFLTRVLYRRVGGIAAGKFGDFGDGAGRMGGTWPMGLSGI